jgi:hypothetical protein
MGRQSAVNPGLFDIGELTMNDQARILPDLTELVAEMARLKAENARLKSAAQSKVGVKLSEKGAISVYGLGRFPVTLYKSQWERMLTPETISRIRDLFPQARDKAED